MLDLPFPSIITISLCAASLVAVLVLTIAVFILRKRVAELRLRQIMQPSDWSTTVESGDSGSLRDSPGVEKVVATTSHEVVQCHTVTCEKPNDNIIRL